MGKIPPQFLANIKKKKGGKKGAAAKAAPPQGPPGAPPAPGGYPQPPTKDAKSKLPAARALGMVKGGSKARPSVKAVASKRRKKR